MERSDYVTLVAVVIATFVGAVVPAIAVFGFDKNSHETINEGPTTAKILATYMVEKGKPLATPVP
jgi:hypothetical protein